VLSRLGKTLSTNAALGGLALIVLGAGGTTATLAAGKSPAPNAHASTNATQHPTDDPSESPDDATENDTENDSSDGTRPTDTHGYCVSQVAQAPTTSTDPGAHGKAVSAAAHSCGGTGADAASSSKADAHRQNGTRGKAFGQSHRPAGAGAAAQR
jgi:hypothetical protein